MFKQFMAFALAGLLALETPMTVFATEQNRNAADSQEAIEQTTEPEETEIAPESGEEAEKVGGGVKRNLLT
ncbi:MAG: hypothetical protein NC302_00225 [Bacteroidales bacterium]|nr:hypothetical protein [Bacteroidales bacterium]MCM1414332.1 hypothetical protein [bacterium]MCM1422213.1 hypothetical protein [bacterium]